MFVPHITKYKSSLTPWELYKKIHPRFKVSFFLDSPTYMPPDQNYSYLGWDPFMEVRVQKNTLKVSGELSKTYPRKDLWKVLRRLSKKYSSQPNRKLPFFSGGAVGFLCYEMIEQFEAIKLKKTKGDLPLLHFGFYRNLIVYDHKKKTYLFVSNCRNVKEKRNVDKIFSEMKAFFELNSEDSFEFKFNRFKPTKPKKNFVSMVKRAKRYIEAGDIYQANLSQQFNFDYQGSELKVYEYLRKINPSPFACFLKLRETHIISSSPERLIQKRNQVCETRPIAGTYPLLKSRHASNRRQKRFLRNEKERAEHIMLVDLERNDLGRVCDFKTVKVDEMMALEKYSHVMHIVSKVTGKLRKDKDVFDLIQAMFPGGTITGCPKIRCMEIIDELEPSARELYTGSIGYFDFQGNLDLNIVIRTLVLQKQKGIFQVGAGIVYDSDPDKEYEETLHKGRALKEALEEASL